MSLLRKFAGETAIYGISSILTRIVSFIIITPFLIKLLEPSQYGVISEMYVYSAFMMLAFTYRMETALFRYGRKKEDLATTFSTSSIALGATTFLFASILLIFSEPLGQLLDESNYAHYLRWFTFIIAFDALAALPFAKLRLQNRPIKFAILKGLNVFIYLIFLLFFLKICPSLVENGVTWTQSFYDPKDKVLYVFIANFIASLAIFVLLLPEYFGLQLKWDSELLKKMLIYVAPLIIVSVAGLINKELNIPLVKHLVPGESEEVKKEILGWYSACLKIAIIMNLVIQAFNYAAEPFFFRNSIDESSRSIYGQVGQAFAFVGSICFLGISLYLDLIKLIIVPDPAYWTALNIVPFFLAAFFFLGLYYNFSIWFKIADKTQYGAYIAIGGSIITLLLNFALIPQIGYMGAAWGALACYIFMAVATYWTGQKHYPISYPIKKMLLYFILAVLVLFLSASTQSTFGYSDWTGIIINTGYLILYIILLSYIEKNALLSLVKHQAPRNK